MSEFVHLHVHTQYSLLDGACRIDRLMERVKALGQKAVAITDHGVMYGVVDFYKAALEAGIKPIIGSELYLAARTRRDKIHEFDAESYHLVLLCQNQVGYQNLMKLCSMGFVEGFYIKPRVDMELLRQYSEGLIALSACLSGPVAKPLAQSNYEGALRAAKELAAIFPERFYLEVQDHGIPEQRAVNEGILRIHEETGIPLVATNDCHYLLREEADMHDVLLCVQTNKTVDEPDRMRMTTQEFYVKSSDEMGELFTKYPDAIENTGKIADLCNVSFEFGKHHLPEFKLPDGWDDGYAYLRHECEKGFSWRYEAPTEQHRERLEYELEMIRQMGFVDYFLIVSDFIAYAKSQGIPVGPGRGSAAGSMVSYCLGITDVEPIKYGLVFERFLNPERISMPDIDIDFCYIRRQEVIDYVIEKYGADHVAQIVTFGTMAARSAIRDVARALGFTYAQGDVAAKAVPFAPHMTLDLALKISPQLKELYDSDENTRHMIDMARAIEGLPRHASTHAAGVVITRDAVDEHVPLARNDEAIVTQFPMGTLEELGLLKMDFLGLRTLTVLHDAEALIQKAEQDFKLSEISEQDKETFDMLGAGKTSGVFQLESAGMTGVCTGLRPQSIEDITAVVALYRPGPMDSIPRFIASKHNPAMVRYKHPLLHDILDVTYGCIVYQEQVLEVFRKLAGFSLGRADMVRRAMSKKKADELERERENFIRGNAGEGIAGCVANGVDEKTAAEIFDEIMDFANYAFNKAHAVAYGLIAYQTAYLKCHYPREFMAALLTSVLDWTAKVTEYIAECKVQGIRVLPPDINRSDDVFTVVDGEIRFGLVAVKNIGRGVIRQVMQEREQNGLFSSFSDFCTRTAHIDMNKRTVESLIKAGAFDGFGAHRAQLLKMYETAVASLDMDKKKNVDGQIDFFSELGAPKTEDPLPQVAELTPAQKLSMEREVTGLYLSGHPMESYKDEVTAARAIPLRRILNDCEQEGGPTIFRDEQKITVAGVIRTVRTKPTRNNSLMAYVTLEDETGDIEMLLFSQVLSRAGAFVQPESPVLVQGKLSVRDEKPPQIMCDALQRLGVGIPIGEGLEPGESFGKLYVKIPQGQGELLRRIQAILTMFPGTMPGLLFVEENKRRFHFSYMKDERLILELEELLGKTNVVVK